MVAAAVEVVVLHEQPGTLDPVVVRLVHGEAARPGEVQILLDRRQPSALPVGHFAGHPAQVLLERFPDVTIFAAPGTIDLMRYHASPEVRASVWDKQFPGLIPKASVVATTPAGNAFELEGSELHIVEVGHTDTDNTTVLHVPSIGLVVAGDAVYNGVHQYLAESANGGIQKWIKALDTIAALRPRRVVASHKNPALDDDPKAIDETRAYLEDAERLSQTSHSALDFYNAMLERYPARLNPTALWFWGARVLFPAA